MTFEGEPEKDSGTTNLETRNRQLELILIMEIFRRGPDLCSAVSNYIYITSMAEEPLCALPQGKPCIGSVAGDIETSGRHRM